MSPHWLLSRALRWKGVCHLLSINHSIQDVAHVIRECPVLGPTPEAWSGMSMAALLGLSTMTTKPYKHFPHLEEVKARPLIFRPAIAQSGMQVHIDP